MQSAWLGEERQFDAVRPGVFTSMSRRVRVALGAVLSALLVAGGLGFAAAPAQANGTIDSNDTAAGINDSFVVLLGDLDATAVTILSENGRDGFQSVDATVGGVGLDLKESSFIEVIDATNVLLYLDTGDTTGTLTDLSVSITEDGTDVYTQSGTGLSGTTVGAQDLGDGILTVFEATAPAAGSKTITFNLRYPTDGTTSWTVDLFAAFNASTGVEVSITDDTFSDATIVNGDYWLVSGALTVDAPFGTSIRFGTVDEDSLSSSGIFAALSNAVTLTAAPTPTPDSGGGGSSTPAAPSTDTGSGSSAGETPAPVQPVVFSDPAVVTPQEIAALSPAQVATITPEQFGDLDPAAFAGFTAAQVQAMNTGQINAIRPARAAQLPLPAVAALDGEQLFVMRPAAVAALKPEALEILTAAQLGSVRPEAFKKMDGERINKIRPVQVEFLNREQIKAINEDGISEMRLDTLREFTRAQVRAFRPDQIAAMSDRQIEVLWGRWSGGLRNVQEQALITEANERGLRLRL